MLFSTALQSLYLFACKSTLIREISKILCTANPYKLNEMISFVIKWDIVYKTTQDGEEGIFDRELLCSRGLWWSV